MAKTLSPIEVMRSHLRDITYEFKNLGRKSKPNTIFHNLAEEMGLKTEEDGIKIETVIQLLDCMSKRCKKFIDDPVRKKQLEAEASEDGIIVSKEDTKFVEDIRKKAGVEGLTASSHKLGTFGPKMDETVKEQKEEERKEEEGKGCMTCLHHGECTVESAFLLTEKRQPRIPEECDEWEPGEGARKHEEAVKNIKEASTFVAREEAEDKAEETRKERTEDG